MKLFIFILSVTLVYKANAQIPPGVYSELSKFSDSNEPLSDTYIQSLPEILKSMTENSEKKLLANSTCENRIEVAFVNSITNSNIEAIKQFESGFVKIDSTYCFPLIETALLLKKSNDPVFRKAAFSTVVRVFSKDNLFCEVTDAPTIGTSNYCYELKTNFSATYSSIQGYNVFNDSDSRFNSPVYFRSIFESARQIGQNTQYHLVTYVRANKLNSVQKFFAKPFIIRTQNEVMLKLQKELQ